ncbi:MAG: 3-phosphoshikimate 1-carboxyvinyltransferase [Eggerthellaceae bacterium]|nr:3-phosphoshikimate 1-carboxyvinyltransferase [Eggerthellaceae bacterium]
MIVRITPSAIPADARVQAPPSKSITHRLLICAGLASPDEGESVIHGVAASQDVEATLDCLRELGAAWRREANTIIMRGADLGDVAFEALTFPCRESGSTLRFLVPLGLALGGPVTLTGSARLLARPLEPYEALCGAQGLFWEKTAADLRIQGPLSPGAFVLPGDVSSQFASGLLFALPLLPGPSTVRLTDPVESRPYINLTLDALGAFDVFAVWQDPNTLVIPGGQTFLPREIRVEGDWSAAANFLSLGVQVDGLNPDSLQGDRACNGIFETLAKGPATIDLANCPDLGPVAMAFAAAHHGGTFENTRRLALKESDRGAAMAAELAKFGVTVTSEENRITVTPPAAGLAAPAETLSGHNDHRIVMALATLCARTGGEITGAEAVAKSFPDFFARLAQAGVDLELRAEAGVDLELRAEAEEDRP